MARHGVQESHLEGKGDFPTLEAITNGVILDLLKAHVERKEPWQMYVTYLQKILPNSTFPNIWTLQKSVQALERKRIKLCKDVSRSPQALSQFLDENYAISKSRLSERHQSPLLGTSLPMPIKKSQGSKLQRKFDVLQTVNVNLCHEVEDLKE